jgi:hypothetical protein
VVAERLGRAEYAQQAVAERFRAGQGVQEGVAFGRVERFGEAGQAQQRLVGVGGAAEGFEEERIAPDAGEDGGVEQALGGGGVGEAVPEQTGEGTAASPLHQPSRRVTTRFNGT